MSIIRQLEGLLATANENRKTRTLSMKSVFGVIEDVKNGYTVSTVNGGTVATAYGYPSSSTVVMAARVNGKVYVGIRRTSGHRTTPGRAWGCLQPYRPETKAFEYKLEKWIANKDVVCLDADPQV